MAALLLITFPSGAAAADNSGHSPKNAQQVIAVLNTIGINKPEVQQFINDTDSQINNGYLNLSEQQTWGGKLSLHYQLDGVGVRQLELQYRPTDSNFGVTARSDSLMIGYRFSFK